MTQQIALDEIAIANARIAREAADDLADYLRRLPPDAWNGPTACTEWSIRDAANHLAAICLLFAGEARPLTQAERTGPAWFAALGDTDPASLSPAQKAQAVVCWKGIDTLPTDGVIDAMERGAHEFEAAVQHGSLSQLQQPASVPFGEFPLFLLPNMLAIDSALHNWDIRARREPEATVSAPWAIPLAMSVANWMPYVSSPAGAASAPGTYLLDVTEGIGPVTVTAGASGVTGEPGATTAADMTVQLTPDQYLRLVFGRLDVAAEAAAGTLTIEGDPNRAAQLNQVFQGI